MKTTQLSRVLVHCILIAGALMAGGCQNTKNGPLSACIQPCSTHTEADKEISGKMGAKLAQINVDANLEASYKNIVKNDFPALSDANARLCLELRAIQCYKDNKIIDQATAQRLAVETFQDYRQRNGISAVGGKLKPVERRLISRSPDADSIVAKLREFNLAN